jgi:hypothetical protein
MPSLDRWGEIVEIRTERHIGRSYTMTQPGMIGICGSHKPSFLQRAIMFFTDSDRSHAFLITSNVCGEEAVQEASLLVQIVPFGSHYRENPESYYDIYQVSPGVVSQDEIDSALRQVFEEYAGMTYGFLQLPWFIWRWINSKFGRDIHKELNWFNTNIICSGEVFDFWIYLGLGMIIPKVMSQYHPSTIAPADILAIVKRNPDLFELVEQKR